MVQTTRDYVCQLLTSLSYTTMLCGQAVFFYLGRGRYSRPITNSKHGIVTNDFSKANRTCTVWHSWYNNSLQARWSGTMSLWRWDFLQPSRLALGPTQPPVQWIKGPGCGIDHLPPSPSCIKVKEGVGLCLLPLWAFMACSRVNFTVFLNLLYIQSLIRVLSSLHMGCPASTHCKCKHRGTS